MFQTTCSEVQLAVEFWDKRALAEMGTYLNESEMVEQDVQKYDTKAMLMFYLPHEEDVE